MVDILGLELCKEVQVSDFGVYISEGFLDFIEVILEMIAHEYCDYYGCYDPMKELAEKLYITDAEILEFADMLNEYDYYASQGECFKI